MLDIGGWEFLVVAFVLIMVVGPKELPKMLRGFTRIIRQVRSMAAEFSRGMQDMADEAELGDIKGTLDDVKRGNLAGVADAIDPGGQLKDSVEDLKKSAAETGLKDDVGEIRDLAGATGDGIAEKVNEAPPHDKAAKDETSTKKKTGS
ncbi:MAG: Sec-independent protein translocase protein TatB [Proteobacteria bacterium]|jgi:sec-independent protein translocase protein TatB|nr:Sec-independent protein translocase protein TatB [Pseudomonadota bacterium]MDA0960462.1 Sec-independent protein translocase protein TatB [Pseudomonadota bacterium]MDA1152087.1 Sec-independent protein translocase protein TatB [Pseudomonadota bacterium]NBP48352.1 twin-arginine translocase subunit TatB [Alphaproteobacteria bacterium]